MTALTAEASKTTYGLAWRNNKGNQKQKKKGLFHKEAVCAWPGWSLSENLNATVMFSIVLLQQFATVSFPALQWSRALNPDHRKIFSQDCERNRNHLADRKTVNTRGPGHYCSRSTNNSSVTILIRKYHICYTLLKSTWKWNASAGCFATHLHAPFMLYLT